MQKKYKQKLNNRKKQKLNKNEQKKNTKPKAKTIFSYLKKKQKKQ